MLRLTTPKTIAALMIASAVFVPAANARPIDAPGVGATPPSAQAQPRVVPLGIERTTNGANPVTQSQPASTSPSVAAPSSGFEWGDAGIGAGAMLVFLTLGAGAVVAIRRSRGRGQPALTG